MLICRISHTIVLVFIFAFFSGQGISQPAFSFTGGLDYHPTYSLNEILDITPDGRKAAVISGSENGPVGASQVAVIDTLSGQRFDTKLVQNIGGAISVKIAVLSDGLKVLVMSDNNGNKYLTIFDLAADGSLTLRAHTQLNNSPGISTQGSNIVYSASTRTAFVAVLSGFNRLYSVNLDTGAVLQTLMASVFDNLNLFEDASRQLIVSGGIHNLVFIDYSNPSQMRVLDSVPIPSSSASFGTNSFSTAFSMDGNYVFAGNGFSLLSAINTATRQIVGTISSSRYRVRRMKIFESASIRFLVMQGLEDGDNAIKGYAVIDAHDPANLNVVRELEFGEAIFQQRTMAISKNGTRLLIGSPGKLSAYTLPSLSPVWEVPLAAFDSAQLTTFGQSGRIFGAWLHTVFSFPDFTNRTSNYDRDGRTDIGTFCPSSGGWQWIRSGDNGVAAVQLGREGDIPVPADYDGDDTTDVAVFRPNSGEWLIRKSSTGELETIKFGTASTIPVPADYDGDGKADVAIFRKYPSRWMVLKSSDHQLLIRKERFGKIRPITGDYDGDGRADFAAFLNGEWQVSNSSGTILSLNFGTNGDLPISGDFDNDGKTDIAVFQPSSQTWRIQQSFSGLRTVQFGQDLDLPVPADYDGDGKTDIAVFRPANSTWQILQSTNNQVRNVQFGNSGDLPLTVQN
jgi:hypothetical protein